MGAGSGWTDAVILIPEPEIYDTTASSQALDF